MAPLARLIFTSSAVVLAVAVMVSIPTPALAHDQLISSSPSSGARLDVAPTQIILQFSQDVLTMGAVVSVADEAGRDWAVGDPTLDGTTVTVPVSDGMPHAGYVIRWQVVSSDGHPISGLVPFTVGDGKPFSDSESSGGTSVGSGGEVQESRNDAALRIVLVGAGGAAIAVGLFALFTSISRRRAARSVDTAAQSD